MKNTFLDLTSLSLKILIFFVDWEIYSIELCDSVFDIVPQRNYLEFFKLQEIKKMYFTKNRA